MLKPKYKIRTLFYIIPSHSILNIIMKPHLFAVTLLFLLTFVESSNKKLIYVQSVFRHGSRYPLYPSPEDHSNLTDIDTLKGQITRQGQSQHYLLGQKLYETYWQKLFGANSKTYKQQKFYFKSTDLNRTIQSLQSQLLGIFENIQNQTIEQEEDISFFKPAWNSEFTRPKGNVYIKSPQYHPLPIHVEKGESTPWTQGDILRTYSKDFCYKQKDWQSHNIRDPYITSIMNHPNFTNALGALGQALKKNVTFFDIERYYDSAICLIYLSKTPLHVFTAGDDVALALEKMYTLLANMRFFYNEQQLRATATGYFNETVNHFKRVTKNQDGVQWSFYSAHDVTLQNYLARMGLSSVNCIYQNYLNKTKSSSYCILETPSFASTLIFEIYQYENNTNTFQIRYNGDYRRIPFCGYQYECNVEQFYSWYESWKDQNWVKNCGIKDTTSETYFSIIIIELGVIIIFAVGAVLNYLDKKKPEINEEPKKSASDEKPGLQESMISEQNEPT